MRVGGSSQIACWKNRRVIDVSASKRQRIKTSANTRRLAEGCSMRWSTWNAIPWHWTADKTVWKQKLETERYRPSPFSIFPRFLTSLVERESFLGEWCMMDHSTNTNRFWWFSPSCLFWPTTVFPDCLCPHCRSLRQKSHSVFFIVFDQHPACELYRRRSYSIPPNFYQTARRWTKQQRKRQCAWLPLLLPPVPMHLFSNPRIGWR